MNDITLTTNDASDSAFGEKLAELKKELEEKLPDTKVLIRKKPIYDGYNNIENKCYEIITRHYYEVVIISPFFTSPDYEHRLNIIWPFILKLPDDLFDKIYSIDCVTPSEYHHQSIPLHQDIH